MTIQTTPERTMELLRAAVEDRGGDFVFPTEWNLPTEDGALTGTCSYVRPDKDEPACIAGYVFHAYGVTIDNLRRHEGDAAMTVAARKDFDVKSKRLLAVAQTEQDSGKPWSEALAAAEREYANPYSESSWIVDA